jgi:signal peptidase I
VPARPALVVEEITVQGRRDLAALPGPSPFVLAALVPAVVLLVLAGGLRRLGAGARPAHGVSPEALAAAERTLAWSVRVVATGAFLVFVVPASLQLAGLQTVSLTTGSMAPAHPAGSLLLVTRPADPAAVPVGEVVVIVGPDGSRVTHRVVALDRDGAGTVAGYRTRGDALAILDPEPVPPASIDGVVVAGIPVLGALRAWMASPLGIAIGLVLACAFALLAALLGDDRRRAIAAQAPAGAPARAPAQAVARSTSRPTS